LVRGDVIRATSAHLDPGGKGVNVSRALLANGVPSCAVLPCGADEGIQLVGLLRAAGVDVRAVPIAGRTRSNITLAEPDGTVTKVNEPGPTLSAAEFAAVTEEVLATTGAADWVVVCGSVPPDLPASAFARLCQRLVAARVRLAVDTSGPALAVVGEGVAIPHGTLDSKAAVRRDALAVLRFPDGVDWDGHAVNVCVAIAALSDGHVDLLAELAEILLDPDRAAALRAATEPDQVVRLLTAGTR
jgi:Phosphoenolpyruvate-dependent sugar phosphotransferase system, EIIA 2/pfkB family carbohydrate kinase